MYRRLVSFALVVVTVAVLALVIPLGLAARDIVRAKELNEVADRARGVADLWENAAKGGDEHDNVSVDIPPGEGVVTLVHPGGQLTGPAVPRAAKGVVEHALQGRSASVDTGSWAYSAAPAVFDEERFGAVLVAADSAQLQEGLGSRLGALAGLSATLLLAAGAAAWVLAKRTADPILRLAGTADSVAAGDLAARAAPSSIPEVQAVGTALNRMAERIDELLSGERTASAELAHQLRTPLTVLAADIDAVADPEVRQRLAEDAEALQRTTDEVINAARRPDREGLRPICDAVAVAVGRAEFWRVLADFQGRRIAVSVPAEPLQVRLTEYDLTTAVDILLQNVFVHTPEGVDLAIGVQSAADGTVALTVSDEGPGFPATPQDSQRTGSTQLGLAIAERVAGASGGRLARGNAAGGGAVMTMFLGRPGR